MFSIKWRRKQYLINPGFQLTVIAYTILLAMLVVGCIYTANHYFFWDFIKRGQDLGLGADHSFFAFLENQRSFMNRVFALVALAIAGLIFVSGILLSHRVSGPIHRSVLLLDELIENPTKVDFSGFRKKDFFPELGERLQMLAKKLSSEDSSADTSESDQGRGLDIRSS